MSREERRILDIQEKIRNFARIQPSNKGMADPSYKVYLAQCSTLHRLDNMLNDLVNQDELEPAEFEKSLSDIENEVNLIVSR